MRHLLERFLSWIRDSLISQAEVSCLLGKKVIKVGPLWPSRRLVLTTAACFLALTALCTALILCVVLLGEAPPELISAIVSLASTLAGIYVGRRW